MQRHTRGLQVGDFSRSADTCPGEAGVLGQGRCLCFAAAGPTGLGWQETGDSWSHSQAANLPSNPPGKGLKQTESRVNGAASSGKAAKKGNRIYFKSKSKALRFILPLC